MDFTKISFALFDVYEFPNGLYTNKDICNKLGIGNPYDRKTINGSECYAISEKDIITVGTTTFYKAKIIPVLDMNISAKFTVYVDENDNNKLLVCTNRSKEGIPIYIPSEYKEKVYTLKKSNDNFLTPYGAVIMKGE